MSLIRPIDCGIERCHVCMREHEVSLDGTRPVCVPAELASQQEYTTYLSSCLERKYHHRRAPAFTYPQHILLHTQDLFSPRFCLHLKAQLWRRFVIWCRQTALVGQLIVWADTHWRRFAWHRRSYTSPCRGLSPAAIIPDIASGSHSLSVALTLAAPRRSLSLIARK